MHRRILSIAAFLVAGFSVATAADAQEVCAGYGPQTPRDISVKSGANDRLFTLAPSASEMNLCNIHFHAQAEHKGPGYKIFAGATDDGGYQCNGSSSLTEAELAPL
ncbi:MAG: hypothetical protein KTR21_03455, partial [Rhodobacteraceae bacterium]|nr:hypothetical protein [Paracoccaceae bacterium]